MAWPNANVPLIFAVLLALVAGGCAGNRDKSFRERIAPPGLTSSEAAARSQRPMSAQEKQIRTENCDLSSDAIPFTAGEGKINGATKLLGDLRILRISQTVSRAGRSALQSFPLLPNGGIAVKDYCGFVTVRFFQSPEQSEQIVVMGLLLRPGLDLARAYPIVNKVVQQNHQTIELRSQRYAIIEAGIGQQEAEIRKHMSKHTELSGGQPYLYYGNRFYFALRDR